MSVDSYSLDTPANLRETVQAVNAAGRHARKGIWVLFAILESLFFGVIVIVAAGLAFAVAYQQLVSQSINESPAAAYRPFGVVAAYLMLKYVRRRRYYAANVANPINATAQTNVDKTGVTQTSANSHMHVGWQDVSHVVKTKNAIALVFANMAIALPKRGFGTSEDADAAFTQIKEWWNAVRATADKSDDRPQATG